MHTSIYNGFNFYVYLITNLNPIGTEKYYIGSSYRKKLQDNNIDPEEDNYYGSSSVPYLRELQDNHSIQLERIIIKTFSSKKECVDYEEQLQREYEAASNPLFYNLSYANGKFISDSETARKSANTKLNNIDVNGLNTHQRVTEIRLNDIDESGLNSYQRANKKANITRRGDIDKVIGFNKDPLRDGLDGGTKLMEIKHPQKNLPELIGREVLI
jgi:hypothetical protein